MFPARKKKKKNINLTYIIGILHVKCMNDNYSRGYPSLVEGASSSNTNSSVCMFVWQFLLLPRRQILINFDRRSFFLFVYQVVDMCQMDCVHILWKVMTL